MYAEKKKKVVQDCTRQSRRYKTVIDVRPKVLIDGEWLPSLFNHPYLII